MISRKLSKYNRSDEIIFRLRKYKNEKSLSNLQLFVAIAARLLSVISYHIRRYRLIFDPKYDFYGWKSRSRNQAEEDLFHESALKKNEYMRVQINFDQISSFLELGSNSGIQIFELAKIYPKCKFVGLDFNLNAVTLANEKASEANLKNLEFFHVDLQDSTQLMHFGKAEWDVIFSWAALIYIHPTKILPILKFGVDNSKCFFLIEQHKKMKIAIKGRLLPGQPTWVRDYVKLFNLVAAQPKIIKTSPIAKEIWKPGGGYATQIIVQ